MSLLIIVIGALILAASLSLIIRPALVIGVMESSGEKTWLYVLAIGVRLVLGWLLIQHAAVSKFPAVITVLGWIALIAAFFILVIGHTRFVRLVQWVTGWVKPWARFGGFFGAVFGAFLIYAFL